MPARRPPAPEESSAGQARVSRVGAPTRLRGAPAEKSGEPARTSRSLRHRKGSSVTNDPPSSGEGLDRWVDVEKERPLRLGRVLNEHAWGEPERQPFLERARSLMRGALGE